jgi:hypothetical protein
MSTPTGEWVLESQLSAMRIAGVAVLLFSAILLGVGIHHLVSTGTCSSTGYSGSFGPVPHCPSGTGWWVAFLFVGIIGGVAGAIMAGSTSLVFVGIFGAIGFGALSLVLDSHASSGTKLFGGLFGGAFALVAVVTGFAMLWSALPSLRRTEVRYGRVKTKTGPRTATTSTNMSMPTPAPTPVNLVPGLQAAMGVGSANTVDELSKLAELHQHGGLTDQEFASAKAKLLGQL